MKFRTEIGPVAHGFNISHDDRIVLLGSCFADNVGELLTASGFDVVHNPAGPLYNPASLLNFLVGDETPPVEYDGVWHCLDMANRFQDTDRHRLEARVRAVRDDFRNALEDASVVILTFGTAMVWERDRAVVSNCHKLPAGLFDTRMLTVDRIVSDWIKRKHLALRGKSVIFTLSPVLYPSYGLDKDSLSKATLRLAIERLRRLTGGDYFPSYEIVTADLRDYRFYADDMRHPSDAAVRYIYEIFKNTYMDEATRRRAAACERAARGAAHRPIITE